MSHLDFDFDGIEIVNNRQMNSWLHAKCRKYLDKDETETEIINEVDVEVVGEYDDNPLFSVRKEGD